MTPEDFFTEPSESFPGLSTTGPALDTDLLDRLRAGRDPETSDTDAALALSQLVHREFISFGTDGTQRLNNHEVQLCVRTLRAILQRVDVPFNPPFSDFDSFKGYWIQNDGHGSWAARRKMLKEIYDPLISQLIELDTNEIASTAAEPVSPKNQTGWSLVDDGINEIKRHFRMAQTEQDYRNIGNDCVSTLEALSAAAYVADENLRAGESEPPVANTKQRLDRVIDDSLEGPGNKEFRKLAKASIEAAQALKHRGTPTRRMAGISADAVILTSNIVRRLVDKQQDS